MPQPPLIDRASGHYSRTAIRSGTVEHSYRDLLGRSTTMAGVLLDGRGDLGEDRVAYRIPASVDYVTTQWGIWRAGGVAVPLSLSATESELEYALTDSQASIVVTTHDDGSVAAAVADRLSLRTIVVDEVVKDVKVDLPEIAEDRRAMILYTSGTTSKPKGVVTTHRCIRAQIQSLIEAWHWRADDRIPLFLPLHHIHGIINVMSCALWSGAEIEAFARFDLSAILRRVAAGAYTMFMAVPTIYVKLIEALEAMPSDERDGVIAGFRRMRLMISGSAALPASVHEKWTELTGQKLLERYGMTEIGMALSNPYEGERRPGAVGQPLPDVEIRLRPEPRDSGDNANTNVAGESESGEIQVRGPGVFLEYWNRPDATSQSFTEGWFRTGDMAVLEDGYYRIMGRSSVDIIKSGGYKLSALEIEAALLDHPAIKECAVVGVPDATWGEAVAAAVVFREGGEIDLETLRQWCKDKISPYKIPRQLRVVDSLPRNAMGKVTKPAVRELLEGD